MDRLQQAICAHVQHLFNTTPITASYRAALVTAVAAPGQILSDTPDFRWARLLWTSCTAAGGAWQQSVAGAAAVELFMTALNILDDEEDGEVHALHSELGAPRALNVSTGLLLLAQWSLLHAPAGDVAANILMGAGLAACSGQHADLDTNAQHLTDLEAALAVTGQKSASLVSGICRLGALYAGASVPTQLLYAQFGLCLGMVLQLTNDIAGVHPQVAGKTDSLLGRPTLPLVYARYRQDRDDPQSGCVDERVDLWTQGPVYVTWAAAAAYRNQAMELVDQLTADPARRDALIELVPALS